MTTSSRRTRRIALQDLADADEVRIADSLNTELDRVTDPAAIAALRPWLADHEDGWHVPREGVWIARTQLAFRRDGVALGSIGLDGEFLVVQRLGTFAQRVSTPADRAAAYALLGVADPEA